MIKIIKNTRAFFLLEILIGLLVFSTIMIVILMLQKSNRERMALSADSFAAIHLSTKVMADLWEDSRLNPTFLEMLQDFPDMLSQDPVIDGQSCFFRCGRDRSLPWGSFDIADGGGIASADGILYQQMNSFKIKVDASRKKVSDSSDPERHLCSVIIETSWKEKDDTARSYQTPLYLYSLASALPTEGLDIDEEKLKDLIRASLFPDLAGETFDQAISNKGCDRELAYHVGKIGVCADAILDAMSLTSQKIEDLKKKRKLLSTTAPDPELVKIGLDIARTEDSMASLLYNVMSDLLPSFQVIEDRGTPSLLAAISYAPYAKGLKTWESLGEQIFNWVNRSRLSYEWLLNDGFCNAISSRQRDFAKDKALETYRLLWVVGRMPPLSILEFLAKEKALVAGKNPYREKFYVREELLMKSQTALRSAFPNLNAIADNIQNKIEPLIKSIPQLIEKHPGNNVK